MKNKSIVKFFFWIFPLCFALAACNSQNSGKEYQPVFVADSSSQNTLVLGFPNFSYSETAALLVEYLNAHLPNVRVKVHACVDWNEYLSFLNQGKFDIGLVNGIVACEATNYGYSICGKVSSDEPYSSLIITQKNSGINKVTDLKGKKVALVPSNTIPSTMMGMYYLYDNGLDVNLLIHKENVASFEAGIISVYLGKSAAAICPRRNWSVYVREHPEMLSKVEIKWETEPLEQNAVLIKNTVDKKVVSDLMNLLFSMHDAKDAQPALQKLDITGFEKADNEVYKPMLDFKLKFDSLIHL